MHIDPETQRKLFKEAVAVLGGNRATAARLNVTSRTIDRLVAGDSPIHEGLLRDIAAELIKRSRECLALERQLSPDFVSNLTESQLERPAHGNTYHRRGKDD